jgi:hypothetical protein
MCVPSVSGTVSKALGAAMCTVGTHRRYYGIWACRAHSGGGPSAPGGDLSGPQAHQQRTEHGPQREVDQRAGDVGTAEVAKVGDGPYGGAGREQP